ncbi:endonuclease-reverse transcriptase [Plakobranchus ocellatus]|uniref:Endonuclease-reverse transcriptase n=1 Tax=Plakobranchus ocellatus TaxID=259542 RepID=A0AAV3YEC2_9GAST|nr:endonuclease-reverse transcriptase [Plakobranchus ocellatus]
MKIYNIFSANIIMAIQSLYEIAKSAVLLNNNIGRRFRTTFGVCQGCLFSSNLFNIFLERIMIEALEDHESTVSIGGRPLTILHFAYDVDGLAGKEEELAKLTERSDKTSRAYGIEINAGKTRITTNTNQEVRIDVKVNGQNQNLEHVTRFKHLGSIVSDERLQTEI